MEMHEDILETNHVGNPMPPLQDIQPLENLMPIPLPETLVGNFQLPIGYRFGPSDKECLVYFLIPKLQGRVLPPNNIVEFDVYSASPDEITGGLIFLVV